MDLHVEQTRKRPRRDREASCNDLEAESCGYDSMRKQCAEWGLDSVLTENLVKLGIVSFFPTQSRLFSVVLNRLPGFRYKRDICFSSPTGSGKTIAFALPVINTLIRYQSTKLRAIIVEPTRALAEQVCKVVQQLIDGSRLKVEILYEGIQISSDIIICTPDTLSDFLETSTPSLSFLEFLVIDEADKLLDHNPQLWLNPIIQTSNPQKLLFSASMTKDSGRLFAVRMAASPLVMHVDFHGNNQQAGSYILPPTLSEFILRCTSASRLYLLLALVRHFRHQTQHARNSTKMDDDGDDNHDRSIVLIFTSSLESSSKLTQFLVQCNIQATEYSSSVSRQNRLNTLSKASSSSSSSGVLFIIASDGACRGLDLPNISLVINYDSPSSALGYLHRIGRCARGGNSGTCIAMVMEDEEELFRQIRSGINDGVVELNVFDELSDGEVKEAKEICDAVLS